MKLIRLLTLAAYIMGAALSMHAQTQDQSQAQSGQVEVVSVEYWVDGRTLQFRLEQLVDLPVGQKFASKTDFDTYIARVKQRLLNERVLESVEIQVDYEKWSAANSFGAQVTVRVKDTWNIIALPYFKYDSNTGLLLSVRARDYNFFGSMLPLRLNANFERDNDGTTVWGSDITFDYPFPAYGLSWNWNFDGSLNFHEEGANPQLALGTGLGTSVALGPGRLDLGVGQNVAYNGRDSDGRVYEDSLYFSSSANLGWTVPLWLSQDGNKLNLRPRVGLSGNWLPGGFEDYELASGLTVNTGAGLSYGTVDWLGNFRQGFRFGADAGGSYSINSESLTRTLSSDAALFRNFDWFGLSLRVSGFYAFDGTSETAGEALRGVLNSRASTDTAITVNLDFPVRIMRFLPAQWFGKPWMRYFEFEQHWSPFIDFSQGHYDDTWFLVSKGWYAGGQIGRASCRERV